MAKETIFPAMIELLVLSLPGRAGPERAPRVRALAAAADADALIALADAHGMTRLLLAGLRTAGLPADTPLLQRIVQVVRHDVAADARHIRELIRLTELFAADRLRVLPMKGPLLAVQAYDDPALRPFRDLDFLVHPADLGRARDRLHREGYLWTNRVPAKAEEAYIRAGWEYFFVNYDRQTHVDLDTGIAPGHFGFRVPPAELWNAVSEVMVEGHPLRTVSLDTLFLMLSAHGAKHAWNRLVWIADIAGLLSRMPDADWDRLLVRATELGARRMVAVAAELASRLANVPLPGALSQAVQEDAMAARVAEQTTAALAAGAGATGFLHTLRFHLAARERPRDRIRYVLALMFTPSYSDWWSFTVPSRLAWLHYIARPFRLFFTAIPRHFRRTRGQVRRPAWPPA